MATSVVRNVYNQTHREPLSFSDRKHCKRLRRQPFRSVSGRRHRFQTLHRVVHADQEFVRSNYRSDTSKSTIMINYNVIKYLNVVSYRLQIVCWLLPILFGTSTKKIKSISDKISGYLRVVEFVKIVFHRCVNSSYRFSCSRHSVFCSLDQHIINDFNYAGCKLRVYLFLMRKKNVFHNWYWFLINIIASISSFGSNITMIFLYFRCIIFFNNFLLPTTNY